LRQQAAGSSQWQPLASCEALRAGQRFTAWCWLSPHRPTPELPATDPLLLLPRRIKEPQSSVSLVLNHPLHRLVSWVEACFSVKAQLRGSDTMEACLLDLRSREPLCIRGQAQGSGLQVGRGTGRDVRYRALLVL
jgi:hypothetical protein